MPLGKSQPGPEEMVYGSGTSIATPIAAGVAALVLEFALQDVLDQTIYGLRIIELVITKECNYKGVMWNEVSRNPH